MGCDVLIRKSLAISNMFQSTHPRGVRLTPISSPIPPLLFQSTHPRGVRPGPVWGVGEAVVFQSTHPRGVRRALPRHKCSCQTWFQSTHPRGVRPRPIDSILRLVKFQSTHPRGVRPVCDGPPAPLLAGFNPRTRVGCDRSSPGLYSFPRHVSIHAPAWGATYARLRSTGR